MIKLLSATLLFSIILASCSTTKPLVGVQGEESSIKGGEVAIRLYSTDKADTVESSINYMFYGDPALPYQDSINRIIKTYVSGIVSNGGGATEQNSNLSVEYFEASMDKFKGEYNRQLEMVDGGGVWQTETSIEIFEENPEFVVLSLSNWNYEGGAHGNAWSEMHIFDIKTGKELLLEDFFSNVDVLTNRAELIFRADQELAKDVDLIEAGFWFDDGKFKLNENFVFNENSVDFLYNQYEIAPYAAGMIIITIPMEDVKDLLKRKVQF